MTAIAVFLAGMSFVLAVIACAIAIAEHRRAEQCEATLAKAVNDCYADVTRLATQGATQAALIEKLAAADVTLDRMIRAVAAASTPPAIPVGEVQIVVPGPRTMQ